MSALKLRYLLPAALLLATVGGFLATRSHSDASMTVEALAQDTHFHGIAADPIDPSRLYLATHHGLYAVAPDGTAELLSPVQDFMGFTPHPSDPSTLYASGHPAGGGNLGFIGSSDGGRTWRRLSDGVGGPVDFHQMDVSKADPEIIYGVHQGLQKSADAGRSWRRVAPAPQGLIGLAASSRDVDTLFAATRQGLWRSTDGGRSWRAAHPARRAASMVHVTAAGDVYAFVAGTGLIRASEPAPTLGQELRWQVLNTGFGSDYILHFAVASRDPRRLYAVTLNPETHAQAVLASRDGGARWSKLGQE
jgi:hypothetical protein